VSALLATIFTLFSTSVVATEGDHSVSLLTILIVLAIIAVAIWIVIHLVRR